MNKKILNLILNDCKKSLKKHPQYNYYPHWTYLIRNNEIIAIGKNNGFEPSKKFGYHRHKDPTYIPKCHSELNAIKSCKRGLENLIVVNVRLNKSGKIRMAMPCKTCRNLLNSLNVKKVFFTTEFGWGQI